MQRASFKISGRSGCILTLKTFENRTIVNKKSPSIAYNNRLIEQASKQVNFQHNPILPEKFSVPEVLEVSNESNPALAWFEMDYINGRSYSEYLEDVSIEKLNEFIVYLIQFLEELLQFSPQRPIPAHTILNKVNDIEDHISSDPVRYGVFRDILENQKRKLDINQNSKIPIGRCHGDLTLSNMIFANDRIYLIDFLDSFIDSPLIDIVKIRQDSKFYWSFFLEDSEENSRKSKIIQILAYLDNKLHNHFSHYDFYQNWYPFFEKINLLRIVPYLTKSEEIQFIVKCLSKSA